MHIFEKDNKTPPLKAYKYPILALQLLSLFIIGDALLFYLDWGKILVLGTPQTDKLGIIWLWTTWWALATINAIRAVWLFHRKLNLRGIPVFIPLIAVLLQAIPIAVTTSDYHVTDWVGVIFLSVNLILTLYEMISVGFRFRGKSTEK